MPPAISSLQPQIRQACEPCRRKKTKCTGERPTCSYCKRLKTECYYMPRGLSCARGFGKREAIDALTRPTRTRARKHQESNLNSIPGLINRISMATQFEASPGIASSSHSPARSIPEPSPEALEHFIEVYRLRLHLQPLPLLCLQNLAPQLLTGPRFLLWAFMALMMNLSTHEFYEDNELTSKNLYARLAEDATMQLVFEGVPTVELTQALCLVALKHIRTQQLAQAWVVIGAASRLEALCALSNDTSPASEGDSISRAHWSVFALERIFTPFTSNITTIHVPDYPLSAPLPPPPLSDRSRLKDIGINGHCLRIIDIWGKIRCYLHQLRQGMVEKPWSPESTHTRLCVEMVEYEAQLNAQYFLCNASLPDRTTVEVSQHREYWNPWITSQLLWHACHVLLNHPFIHTFLLRSPEGIPPSCLFLQQRADLAIYHTGWLFRILEECRNLTDVVDPIIADAIAAASTALWLFQFSRDAKVSRRAQENLAKCDAFLNHVAQTWPHISQKLNTLTKLQALAESIRLQSSDQDATISFQPAWFWELLDPRICNNTQNGLQKVNKLSTQGLGHSGDSRICLKSHFVMPLDEGEHLLRGEQPSDSHVNIGDSLFVMPEELESFDIDLLSLDFLHNRSWQPGL
ncbi:hypothetical protein LCI18_010638 [Fusarium solani-melongenae]|uniref:Uncharacterized protein n=1 Tax=Fusarium solani subsp. cucurbitae TaxID=2747967 RepID=A0ACD3ZF49_FUSSC|nr:hypothetical protein LCI18_010638 [Fusarium solani-melongenae]